MKFNLRKYVEAKKNVETSEVALDSQRENLEEVTGSYNALLESVRKNKEDAKVVTTEGELKDGRTEDETADTIEAQLDKHKPGKDMPKRTGNDQYDQLPINLLEEASHQERIKAFRSSTVKDSETEFWDEFLTSADVKPAPSQLHNHSDRFKNLSHDDVLKNEGVRQMVVASLQDADAMLYHIYRQAATERRDLSKQELMLVDGITADKIKMVNKMMESAK